MTVDAGRSAVVDHGDTAAARADEAPAQTGPRRSTWLFWALLGLITLIALVVRLIYLHEVERTPALGGDPFWYHGVANLIAGGRGIVNPFLYFETGELAQSADHPPLLSFYLAGWSWFGFDSTSAHRIATVVLGCATVVVGGLAGRRIRGPVLGAVGALLLAVHPNVWRYDGTVQAESAAVFATIVIIWLAYRYLADPGVWRLVAVSVAVGVGALARPELLLLSVLLVVPLALGRGDLPPAQRWRWIGAAAAGCVAVLAPWAVFNVARLGEPVFLSSQLEVTLATANCETTYDGPLIGYWDLRCGERIVNSVSSYKMTAPESRPILRDAASRFVGDHTSRIPAVVAARLGRLTGIGLRENQIGIDHFVEGTPEPVARWGMNLLYPTMVLSVVGAVVLRRAGVTIYPLLAPIAVVVATVVVLYTATRFRAPADAAMCLLVAGAIDGAVRWLRSRRSPT